MIFIIINKSILKLFFFLFAAEASGLDDCDKSTFKKELISIWWLLQLCLTLSLLMGCSPPGLSVHGIFQARILESCRGQHNIVNQLSILQLKKKNKKKGTLEWVALPSSRRSSAHRNQTCVSCLLLWLPPPGKPTQLCTHQLKCGAAHPQFPHCVAAGLAASRSASQAVTFSRSRTNCAKHQWAFELSFRRVGQRQSSAGVENPGSGATWPMI